MYVTGSLAECNGSSREHKLYLTPREMIAMATVTSLMKTPEWKVSSRNTDTHICESPHSVRVFNPGFLGDYIQRHNLEHIQRQQDL